MNTDKTHLLSALLASVERQLDNLNTISAESWSDLWINDKEEWYRLDNRKMELRKLRRQLESTLDTINSLEDISKVVYEN